MLEKEEDKTIFRSLPGKNLKYALLALGYSLLAGLFIFLTLDSFGTQISPSLIQLFPVIYYILLIVSGVYAFLACRNSLKSLGTNKDIRNYLALVIGGFLLLGLVEQIIKWI